MITFKLDDQRVDELFPCYGTKLSAHSENAGKSLDQVFISFTKLSRFTYCSASGDSIIQPNEVYVVINNNDTLFVETGESADAPWSINFRSGVIQRFEYHNNDCGTVPYDIMISDVMNIVVPEVNESYWERLLAIQDPAGERDRSAILETLAQILLAMTADNGKGIQGRIATSCKVNVPFSVTVLNGEDKQIMIETKGETKAQITFERFVRELLAL